ncbi:MAG: CHAP domain-containing protein [Solirubrobacteraceae bacterium]
MSIQSTVTRIDAIRQAIADPAELIGASTTGTGGVQAPEGASFADALAQAGTQSAQASAVGAPEQEAAGLAGPNEQPGVYGYAPGALPTVGGATGSGPGAGIVAAAESQIGQTEQPPGSNESPAIAEYRSATAGAIPGAPWCAYFASWAARQAGEPIGAGGQGLGSVSEIWSWAQSTGRAIPNGPGVEPQPGDLIVFGGEHVGIVRGVLPDGQIATIEGNYENKVSANVRSPGEATGYVNMG